MKLKVQKEKKRAKYGQTCSTHKHTHTHITHINCFYLLSTSFLSFLLDDMDFLRNSMLRYNFWLRFPCSNSGEKHVVRFGVVEKLLVDGDLIKFFIEWLRIKAPFNVGKRLVRFNFNVLPKVSCFDVVKPMANVDAVTQLINESYLLLYVDADILVLCLR